MNVPAELLDQYADELFTMLENPQRDELDNARLTLMANSLKNMARDLRGDGDEESRRRRTWWIET